MIEKYSGAVFVVLLACVGIATTLRADFSATFSTDFEDGSTQQELQSIFDESLPHRGASLSFWNALRFRLFQETAEGAVAGNDGWIFTAEEYEYVIGADLRFAEAMASIADTAATLRAQNIHLVVSLIPDKSRIYPEFLRSNRPAPVINRYEAARALMVENGIDAPDLLSALLKARDTTPVFLERDTHWTPFGAQAVAQALAGSVRSRSQNRSAFEVTPAPAIAHSGDLLKFVETGPFAKSLGLLPEIVMQFDIYPVSGSIGLFDDPAPVEVALIGTSYSADPLWNFASFLRFESEAELLNLSQVGMGPFFPMVEFLNADITNENNISVVVWEIPERFLTLSEF
jgi:alginate O-acetyltransferase complex protein AlgJ